MMAGIFKVLGLRVARDVMDANAGDVDVGFVVLEGFDVERDG